MKWKKFKDMTDKEKAGVNQFLKQRLPEFHKALNEWKKKGATYTEIGLEVKK